MKKIIILSGLILLFVWGGLYALSWYGAQRALDRLATEWSSQGDLRWDGVRPRLGGEVVVRGVRWHWFDITQPITFDKVILSTPGTRELLAWLLRDQWPSQWSLHWQEMELQLQPDLFRPWARERPSRFMARAPLALTACGQRSVLAPADFLQMGIDRVSADLTLRYREQQEGTPYFDIDLNAGPLGSVAGQLEVPLSRFRAWIEREQGWPVPDAMEVTLRDAGFMRRLAAYCAAREDKTPETWAQLSTERWEQAMQAEGLVPTESLTAFYQQWLKDGGELQLAWRPDKDVDLAEKDDVSAEDWRRAQGLDIVYNGTELAEAGVALSREPENDEPPQPIRVQEPELEMTARYYESDLVRAAAWIDRRVKITLASGRVLEGQLASRDARYLYIRREVAGGEIVAPVALEDIEEFAVWRRPDDPGRPVSEDEPAQETDPVFAPWLDQIQPVPAGAPSDD